MFLFSYKQKKWQNFFLIKVYLRDILDMKQNEVWNVCVFQEWGGGSVVRNMGFFAKNLGLTSLLQNNYVTVEFATSAGLSVSSGKQRLK